MSADGVVGDELSPKTADVMAEMNDAPLAGEVRGRLCDTGEWGVAFGLRVKSRG